MTTERLLGNSYVLEDIIGCGAMGQVWRGRDRDGHQLAFKLLRPELAEDPKVVQRPAALSTSAKGEMPPCTCATLATSSFRREMFSTRLIVKGLGAGNGFAPGRGWYASA